MNQVQEIARLVDDALGAEAIGTYLHGSSLTGGLKPASDVDVLVCSRRTLTVQERHALVRALLAISGSRNAARPVELAVVVQDDVRPWRYPPTCDFMYGEWLRPDHEAGHVPRREPMPDLAVLITQVLAGDRPLAGPAPAQVLDPVPHADVVRASLAGLPGLLDELTDDARNVVLTLARVWATLATGRILSKDAAAEWALPHLPPEHRAVLEHARGLYLGATYAEEAWSSALLARVRPYADRVSGEIERLARARQ
ncbi:aminoglycoside adenylyltransferase family protein [Promicromonospora vindobonensis]|uniref:Aminoglycoside adenylyltransferase family protein n=1 Tax=Promicromonospora vindobonensis TaxID=195748 RepID=A0ABW5VZB4_9MICO